MKIQDILSNSRTISYEFFPPKAAEGIPGVIETLEKLKVYGPHFVSVTYGAGGSTRAFTEEITIKAKNSGLVEVMAHLTCVGQTVADLDRVLQRLEAASIENVIGLRGDPPRGEAEFMPVEGGFTHAADLVKHIQLNYSFGIGAACYPEGHAESVDFDTDLGYTKLKVENGADFLITQLFYDNDDYFTFVERARAAGSYVPIIPGILPVLSAPQIRRFTGLCGSKIPADLEAQLVKYADDDDGAREMGVEYASRQVEGLWAAGVPGVHFYVLNRSYSVSKILDNLRLPGHMLSQPA